VRDAAGSAVAGACVTVGRMARIATDRSPLARLFLGVFETTTNRDGAYAFEGVDVERDWPSTELVWATHPTAGASLIREMPKTDATIDFVLIGTGRIEGTIENLQGGSGMLQAVRADEPRAARPSIATRTGASNLPCGDYVIELHVPGVAPVHVAVAADQTARVTFAIAGPHIKLTVVVPDGRSGDLRIESTTGVAIGGARMISQIDAEDFCTFEHVRPGGCRISLDGERWKTITVDESPQEQMVLLLE
jgi:hypothetical protein